MFILTNAADEIPGIISALFSAFNFFAGLIVNNCWRMYRLKPHAISNDISQA